ncbi:hypothetical protein CEP52_016799 [Fusarium oligoseptatum]|uniref:Uncharacterized protein n=1 Tax=Fusarium oligoseptatum TaxID=2604345 RepID=A0A428RZV5_9HYPO|nr:hypothetical protein CEP52_016799 [Fusarium oligoseptatum]
MSSSYAFMPGVRRAGTASDIQLLESQLGQMGKLAGSLQRHAPLGSDDALKAGFDPANPTKVDELSKRVGSLAKQAREVEKGIDLTQTALEQLEKSREVVDRQLPDDETDRRQACINVVRLLVNSPTKFHTLLRGLGVEVTEEIKEALDNASRRGCSDFQAGQLLDQMQEEPRHIPTRTQDLKDQHQRLEEGSKTKFIKSNVPNDLARLINMGMANGASGYVAQIDMIYEDDIAKARKSKKLTQNIESSLGRPRPEIRVPDSYFANFGNGPSIASRVTEPQRPADEAAPESATERSGGVIDMGNMGEYQCENCTGPGHNMVWCLKVPEGELEGCTLCHSLTHCIDECNTFLAMPLQDQVKVLVYDRFSLPPLKTKEHWFQWLCRWLSHPDSRDQSPPAGYPWSEDYTAELGFGIVGDVDALQEDFDQHKDVARLPRDPATADYDAVNKTYG